MGNLQWLHSGGSFNKEPANDLGSFPSKFGISGEFVGEFAGEPNVMNNLFDDVMPEEAADGITDYRCFYIWNPSPITAIENAAVAITECPPCGPIINFGSKLVDDVQIVHIDCHEVLVEEPYGGPGGTPTPEAPPPGGNAGPGGVQIPGGFAPLMFNPSIPDSGGFVIIDTEFGPPFTIYWKGSFALFGADLQAALISLPWCSGVTVAGSNPYTVTFQAEVGNRNVQLMRVVQNDLLVKGVGRYNTVTYYSTDPWNGYGDFSVKTVYPISDYVQPSGMLRIYNPLTGIWDGYPYYSFSGDIFNLSIPLAFNMVGFIASVPPYNDVNDPQNWQRGTISPETDTPLAVPWGVVEAPILDKNCQVCIYKETQGSPINTYAKPIINDRATPDTTALDMNAKYIGNLKPNEGFYLWCQRIVPPGAPPCWQVNFNIRLTATAVNWPLT
jgi:hypothetical protein